MRARIAILTITATLAITATAQASELCFYPDSTNSKSEQGWEAIRCWQDYHWWVNGYSNLKLLVQINVTASRWQMTGFNLHPKALVDWDSAAENSQPGLPLPAGYWVTVYQ